VKDTIKKATSRTVQFVSDHRMPIAIVTTAAVTGVLVKKWTGNMHESAINFITEKGLLEEYYTTFEDVIN
jgi:hypothetical protein